jgi:hypothetical protein
VKKTPANTKRMMVGEAIGKTIHKLHALAKSLQHPECGVDFRGDFGAIAPWQFA